MRDKSLENICLWTQIKNTARVIPDRDAIIWGAERRSYSELVSRSENLAKYLASNNFGCFKERDELENHESGQDHVAIYQYNGPSYVESMLACFASRTAPLNVNYRYVAEELKFVLEKAQVKVIVYDARFANNIEEIRDELPNLIEFIEVGGDQKPALDGAVNFEEIVANSYEGVALPEPKPEDLCIIYTGGTTGMPKAVLWKQADLWNVMITASHPVDATKFGDLDELLTLAEEKSYRVMCIPPLMHLSGLSVTQMALTAGSTVVFAKTPESLHPEEIWNSVEKEKVAMVVMVGNAVAQPLLEALEKKLESNQEFDLSSLLVLVNGGAAMGSSLRDALLKLIPETAVISDGVGSSESGKQLSTIFTRTKSASHNVKYQANSNCLILSLDFSRILDENDTEEGWLASVGKLPLGYFNETEKTRETFPVLNGTRYSIPGDKAKYVEGKVVLLGRDSATINSGGEKIFAEEVEQAILTNPEIKDVIVIGRPSVKWGSEVVAIVSTNTSPDSIDIISSCENKIARYKLPKEVIYVDEVVRSPNGKPDYKWAKSIAECSTKISASA